MKTLAELDDAVAGTLDAAPDGRRWFDRRLRCRRRIKAACLATMPAYIEYGDNEAFEELRSRAADKCGSVILTIIGSAVLSWLIQKLCDWIYNRWIDRNAPGTTADADIKALRSESCVLLETEGED